MTVQHSSLSNGSLHYHWHTYTQACTGCSMLRISYHQWSGPVLSAWRSWLVHSFLLEAVNRTEVTESICLLHESIQIFCMWSVELWTTQECHTADTRPDIYWLPLSQLSLAHSAPHTGPNFCTAALLSEWWLGNRTESIISAPNLNRVLFPNI